MREVGISELKTHLSRFLAVVRKGEVVRVLDRNRPVAHIVPISQTPSGGSAGAEILADLERKGLIRRGSGRIAREILDRDPPGKPCGVLAALLEERNGR